VLLADAILAYGGLSFLPGASRLLEFSGKRLSDYEITNAIVACTNVGAALRR
jgi:hypothetical protein